MLAEINVTGAVDDAQATRDRRRIATSPLVKTALFGHDANWGRVLMAAGQRAVQRRLRGDRRRRASTLRYNGTVVLDHGRADRRRAGRLGRRAARSTLDLGLGDGQRRLPDERPLLRLRPHQRGLPDREPLVVKVGGASRRTRRARCSSCAATATRCASCTAPGRRSRAEMERARHPRRVRRRPPRDDARRGSRSCARRSRRSTRRSARRSASARCRSSATRSGCAAEQVPELGLVGDPVPSRRRASRRGARRRAGSRSSRRSPRAAERERRRRRRRARASASAPTGSLFLTDVDGLILDGEVVDSIDVATRDELLASGTLEGGIIPKLRAAVTAARERRRRRRSAARRSSA